MPMSNEYPPDDIDLLSSPVTLPNGVVIPNRLAKAAMEEGLKGGLPGRRHRRLYRRWGRGGWGVVLTGNVQVDAAQPATPHDLRIHDSPHTVPLFHELHESLLADAPDPRPLTLVQLSHAGMQSSATYSLTRAPWVPSIGPISGRPSVGTGFVAWAIERALWPVAARAVTNPAEWCEIAGKFVDAATAVEDAGWSGVQLHSAHGYLLAEYLSPLTNPHPRPLPGVPERVPVRLHLLWLILTGIHTATERTFVKALKINCSDFVAGGLDEDASAEIIREIVRWRLVDLLEVSGGTYGNPAFAEMGREALFAHFTRALLPTLPPAPEGPAIMLTGGLHDRSLIARCIRSRAADLVGIGRPAALQPELPVKVLLNRALGKGKARVPPYIIPGSEFYRRLLGGGKSRPHSKARNGFRETNGVVARRDEGNGIKLVGAGVSTVWHEWQMARIGRGENPDPTLDFLRGALANTLWHDILGGGPRGWYRHWMGTD
ncbi:hypothetical protein CcaverHIS002_0704380 [Cutaneotrichosporon cavernicola]|nr:hypothetical protein CcaverHIS002_0704380 [Cutaneotrichosporon cavernicola]BEJ02638.1 hypothetical protein CcaverHIS631_0704330 [Cutaneotrichosporon cavernicola]